jgi:hypothetical protein
VPCWPRGASYYGAHLCWSARLLDVPFRCLATARARLKTAALWAAQAKNLRSKSRKVDSLKRHELQPVA